MEEVEERLPLASEEEEEEEEEEVVVEALGEGLPPPPPADPDDGIGEFHLEGEFHEDGLEALGDLEGRRVAAASVVVPTITEDEEEEEEGEEEEELEFDYEPGELESRFGKETVFFSTEHQLLLLLLLLFTLHARPTRAAAHSKLCRATDTDRTWLHERSSSPALGPARLIGSIMPPR